jgi:hypothetical protein
MDEITGIEFSQQMWREIKENEQRIAYITKNWDIDDWTAVRNDDYFYSDYLNRLEASRHKLQRITYYHNKGQVLPYDEEQVKKKIKLMDDAAMKKKSILDPNKERNYNNLNL